MLARKMFIGLAALVLLAVATPTMADEFKGWYGVLDLALTQPAGLDQNYATNVDYGPFPYNNTETERLVLDNDDSLDFTAAFGYSFGKMGMLQVSYWGTSGGDSFDGTAYGALYPTLAPYSPNIGYPDLYGDAGYPIEFEAESDTTARIWDIDYIRPMAAGDKFSVNWIAGFRVAEFKENVFFDGTDFDSEGYVDERYIQERHVSSTGWGFKVGATANMDFTKHFGMEASLAVSFLQGTSKGKSTICDESCGRDPNDIFFADQDDAESSDDSMRGEIRDYGLAAVWHQGPVDIFAGFKSSNWDGLPSNPNPGTSWPVGSGGGADRNDVTFNSWHVGAKWKIGG